jgi:hypothetical protein
MANAGARVYHTDTGKLDIELTGVDASITKMSRSGRYVAAGNARNFGVFDRVRGSWIIHDFVRVEMVSFDPGEKRVFLAGSRGDSMQVRDLETGLQLPTVFETAGSKFFVFSTDGRRAYAMAGAKRLNVYDAATGTVMAEIPCEGFPNNPDGFESLLLEQLNHK